ncbi:MAG TPA: hypothetical protein VN755_07320, partial [Steroidobacteraceae bacterium]|nr:hypothetical protein [Steroidobacteraceae bacterium]
GDEENVRQKVAAFMRVLNAFAAEMEMAVLLLGHPAKAEGSEYSGSGAWSSKVRSRLFFEEDGDAPGLMALRQRKASWGAMAPDLMFQRNVNGVLLPLAAVEVEARHEQATSGIRTMIIDTLRAAAKAGESCSAAANQQNSIGRMVVKFIKGSGVSAADVNEAAGHMMAEGLLATVYLDGKEGRPCSAKQSDAAQGAVGGVMAARTPARTPARTLLERTPPVCSLVTPLKGDERASKREQTSEQRLRACSAND